MKSFNGVIAIGAPFSVARYQHATRVCNACLQSAEKTFGRNLFYTFAKVGNVFLTEAATCYVCETAAECYCVKPHAS